MTIIHHKSLRHVLVAATMLATGPLALVAGPANAQFGISISAQIEPPVLPVYEQPVMPETGYVWTPGYWSWNADAGYYWVPGTWVLPPVGLLWTPPYWGWSDGGYLFHSGYWGEHVGYYGGVNYGYGYGGSGYQGGRWQGGAFAYNTRANNFGSLRISNSYSENVTVVNESHVSYAGGAGGLHTQPTAADRAADNERHVPATHEQAAHITAAAGNPAFAAKQNMGHPAIAATSRPGQFEGSAAVAKPAAAEPNAKRGVPAPAAADTLKHPVPERANTPVVAPHQAPAVHPATEHPVPAAARPVEQHPVPAAVRPVEQHPAPAAHPEAKHPEAAPAKEKEHGSGTEKEHN